MPIGKNRKVFFLPKRLADEAQAEAHDHCRARHSLDQAVRMHMCGGHTIPTPLEKPGLM